MRTYEKRGIYGTGTVYILEKVEDFDELAKAKNSSKEDLDRYSNFSAFKEDFVKCIGKLWVDRSQPDADNIYEIIGIEYNEPMADWYWIVRNINDKDQVKYHLANDHSFSQYIIKSKDNCKDSFMVDVINRDFQGWPVYKLSLRKILNTLGFKETEQDGKKYISIESDSKLLDAYPITLEDDGMGYGINKKYITEASKEIYKDKDTNDEVFNLFIESYSKENVDKIL